MATPAQAGNFLKPMHGLFSWAIGLEYIEKNPCDGVKAPKLNNSLGFEAWTEQDVDKYEAKWTEGTKERVWDHVLLHNECVATPDQAGNFLKPMRGLFNWAIGLEYTEKNPCDGVKAPKLNNSLGFDAWTEQDVDKYEAKWTEGTKERVLLHVLLHKKLRRGDAVRLEWHHVHGGVATIRTEKSDVKMVVTLLILPVLDKTLRNSPTSDLAFICGSDGQPLTKETFGNYFRAACDKAGVHKSAHGVRKISATRAANAGRRCATYVSIRLD